MENILGYSTVFVIVAQKIKVYDDLSVIRYAPRHCATILDSRMGWRFINVNVLPNREHERIYPTGNKIRIRNAKLNRIKIALESDVKIGSGSLIYVVKSNVVEKQNNFGPTLVRMWLIHNIGEIRCRGKYRTRWCDRPRRKGLNERIKH